MASPCLAGRRTQILTGRHRTFSYKQFSYNLTRSFDHWHHQVSPEGESRILASRHWTFSYKRFNYNLTRSFENRHHWVLQEGERLMIGFLCNYLNIHARKRPYCKKLIAFSTTSRSHPFSIPCAVPVPLTPPVTLLVGLQGWRFTPSLAGSSRSRSPSRCCPSSQCSRPGEASSRTRWLRR